MWHKVACIHRFEGSFSSLLYDTLEATLAVFPATPNFSVYGEERVEVWHIVA